MWFGFTSRMWCSPCAPLCSSLCSIQRDTPQFAYPVPSRCLLRALRLQLQWFRAPVFKLLDEGAGLISSAFPWRNDTVRSPDEHFQRKTLTLFSSLFDSFSHKMWGARSLRGGVLPTAIAAWLKGRSRLPFRPLLPQEQEEFACKRWFVKARWDSFLHHIFCCFSFFSFFFFLNSTLKWVENECALPEQQGLLDWFRLKVGGGLNTDKKKQQCNRYAIILQLYYPRDFAVHAPLIHIHVDLKIGFLVANSWYR